MSEDAGIEQLSYKFIPCPAVIPTPPAVIPTETTEWERPLSGVHSIMMEKLAQPGEGGGGCTPTPFHYIYHHVLSCSVRYSCEGRYTPPISTLSLYVLCGNTATPLNQHQFFASVFILSLVNLTETQPDTYVRSQEYHSVCPLVGIGTTEYTELQPLLSGVHSVMRVKSVLAGEGGGARPPPLITFTITSKVAKYAPAEKAGIHYPYFYSTPICTLW